MYISCLKIKIFYILSYDASFLHKVYYYIISIFSFKTWKEIINKAQ